MRAPALNLELGTWNFAQLLATWQVLRYDTAWQRLEISRQAVFFDNQTETARQL